jgi:hypothetical protein
VSVKWKAQTLLSWRGYSFCVPVRACAWVCVCVCERERETDRNGGMK